MFVVAGIREIIVVTAKAEIVVVAVEAVVVIVVVVVVVAVVVTVITSLMAEADRYAHVTLAPAAMTEEIPFLIHLFFFSSCQRFS